MALFGSKKNKGEEKEVKPAKAAKAAKAERPEGSAVPGSKDVSHVLRQPRITEKASFISEKANVYVFEVAPSATKREISAAMQALYKVTPARINMATIPAKKVIIRGKRGVKSGGKKAYVYLKEGVTIEVL